MSQVFAPALEGLILLAVVYALAYLGVGYAAVRIVKATWKWWRA